MKRHIVRTTLLLVGLFSLVFARTALATEGVAYLSADELRQMIEQKPPGLTVIDSRSILSYEEGHIKGAVSLPLGAMESDGSLPNVPKDAPLVFYCSGNT